MNISNRIKEMALMFLCIALSSCAQTNQNQSTQNAQLEVINSDSAWKTKLTDEQYYILREKGTEAAFSGEFLLHKEKGNYTCAACHNILFSSNSKFDSHCGWPSFDKQIADKNIITKEDNSHGMQRTEIMCGKCGGHLGHLFNDGPTSTGLRYCVNSISLSFEPANKTVVNHQDTITLGGGCFWCMEAVFQQLKGVESVSSGYAGGNSNSVSYKEVCNGNTGHAEVIQIVFDTSKISLTEILKVYFTVHDPTTLNQQGADKGTQYRSVIFYKNDSQEKLARAIIAAITKENAYDKPIVTEVSQYKNYIKAESYHQNYYNNNKEQAYCQYVIQPKLEKFEKAFANLKK
jgi:peptide methionine sulfoxide reductase msrA/msrB